MTTDKGAISATEQKHTGNMISRIRRMVQENGQATIGVDEYNQLQAEWITRCANAGLFFDEADRIALTKDRDTLAAKVKELEAQRDKLLNYVDHEQTCTVFGSYGYRNHNAGCSCGHDDIIAKIEAEKAG